MTGHAERRDGPGVDDAVRALAGRRILALTGAGVSTDSGIPDYRGEDSPPRTPMTFQAFRDDPAAHRRYWAGSHLGWRRFGRVIPNDGHLALAALESRGLLAGVVTQNVDALHLRAGSRRVVELHGTMHRVVCLACGQVFSRDAIADRLEVDNPWLSSPEGVRLAPDGDVDVRDASRVVPPLCSVCAGMLKPQVVFFGEFVPRIVFAAASALMAGADALLVAGSSLAVNSGVRIVEQARRRSLPIVVVNRGATRVDARVDVKLDGGASELLPAIAERLGGLGPL